MSATACHCSWDHKGAVEMATEKSKGEYGPAKDMADDIVTAQNAETEVNKLLGKG